MIKRIIAIVGMSILITFSCKGQKNDNGIKNSIYPSETFSVIQATLSNGKPVVGSMNMAYKNYKLKGAYPWCLKISIALDLDSVYSNGLPQKGEQHIADIEEDSLISKIRKISIAHYVGHLFNDTFLDIYLYVKDPKPIHEYLQNTKDDKKLWKIGFGWEINEDASWDTVKPFME